METIKIFRRKIQTFIKKPETLFIKLLYFLSPMFSDRLYLKLLFPLKVGYKLNLKKPKTYNQKLQWLKLNFREKYLTKLVDKYAVKEHVKKEIGEEHVIKNYGVWDEFDQIDFNKLPNQFVLKTTHDQGGVVLCKDKSTFNLEGAKKKINRHLNNNIFNRTREWPYKNVEPRIIAEEFIVDESETELRDYKFFCFHGEPKALFIATERQKETEVKFDYFDIEFNHLDIVQVHPKSGKTFSKPKNYDLMVEIARKLSKGLPHVRIDLYNVNGRILFGEYTFFHHEGMKPFHPKEWDYKFGSWIDLTIVDK